MWRTAFLPKIHENVEPVEEHIGYLRSEANVWHEIFRVPNCLIAIGVVHRQLVVFKVVLCGDEHIPRHQCSNSMQNEDEEDYPEPVTRRLCLQLCPIHCHVLEVKLIVRQITSFPRGRESNWLRRLISTCASRVRYGISAINYQSVTTAEKQSKSFADEYSLRSLKIIFSSIHSNLLRFPFVVIDN